MGIVAWNTIGSLIAIFCVYIFLHRKNLKKNKILFFLSRPLHKIIKNIAIKRLKNRKIE